MRQPVAARVTKQPAEFRWFGLPAQGSVQGLWRELLQKFNLVLVQMQDILCAVKDCQNGWRLCRLALRLKSGPVLIRPPVAAPEQSSGSRRLASTGATGQNSEALGGQAGNRPPLVLIIKSGITPRRHDTLYGGGDQVIDLIFILVFNDCRLALAAATMNGLPGSRRARQHDPCIVDDQATSRRRTLGQIQTSSRYRALPRPAAARTCARLVARLRPVIFPANHQENYAGSRQSQRRQATVPGLPGGAFCALCTHCTCGVLGGIHDASLANWRRAASQRTMVSQTRRQHQVPQDRE